MTASTRRKISSMIRKLSIAGFVAVTGLLAGAGQARAQLAALSDEIIVLSKGLQQQERARTTTPLGRTPGAGAAPFSINPGGGGSRISELTNPARSSDRYRGGSRDLLSSAAGARWLVVLGDE